MKRLGNLFKKKKTYETSHEGFKLCIINDDTEYLHTKLGITEERISELSDICVKGISDSNDTIAALEAVLSKCKHINEVTICIMLFGKLYNDMLERMNMYNLFKSMQDD